MKAGATRGQESGLRMHSTQCYEIFQKLPSQEPTWVETVTGLDSAMNRLKELEQKHSADYFILERGSITFITQFNSCLEGDEE
jgi:hypothetical protein